jgi:hypothetical protein
VSCKGSNRVAPEVHRFPATLFNSAAKCAFLLLTQVVHIVTTELFGFNLSRRIVDVCSGEM